jgi:hypothetical protein
VDWSFFKTANSASSALIFAASPATFINSFTVSDTIGQLRAMWQSGKLTAEDYFSTNTGENWNSLSNIVCELEPLQRPLKVQAAVASDNETGAYQRQVAYYLSHGWIVLSEGSTGAQLQGPKEMSIATILCLVFGALLLVAWGTGLILIIAALIGHALKKPKTLFISRNAASPVVTQTPETKFGLLKTLIAVGVALLVVGIIIFVSHSKSESDQQFQNAVNQLANPSSNAGNP